MKRVRVDLADVASHDNLSVALWQAARGKRDRPEVAAFLAQRDERLAALSAAILEARAPDGRFDAFWIRDPKRRLIHAASFADRVLHHAMLNLAEPVFERSLVATTYACRFGLGVHRAVRRVQHNLRRHPWFVKVDVDAFFASIRHDVLQHLLGRRFKGAPWLDLWRRVIAAHHASPGCGLPIGALTSQHAANLYLDGADRLLLGMAGVRGHVRYMDDIVWWCDDRERARASLGALERFLAEHRGLRLKLPVHVGRSSEGVSYCGFRVLPGTLLLSRRKRRRYRVLRQAWERRFARGEIDALTLQRGYDAVHAVTLEAASASWRRENLKRFPPRYPS